MNQILILNYHSIINSQNSDFIDPIYSIDEIAFIEQLKTIQKLNVEVILVSQIKNLKPLNRLYIAITFDDAHESDYLIAFPILEKFGFKATFYIPTSILIGDKLKIEQYQKIISAGHQIGPHGKSHKYLSDLNYIQQFRELKESKEILELIYKERINYFSLPGGKYNQTTLEISKKIGYFGLLTTQFGLNNIENNSFKLKRWTIKKNTKTADFEKILLGNNVKINTLKLKSNLKKVIFKLFSNKLIDIINYKINR